MVQPPNRLLYDSPSKQSRLSRELRPAAPIGGARETSANRALQHPLCTPRFILALALQRPPKNALVIQRYTGPQWVPLERGHDLGWHNPTVRVTPLRHVYARALLLAW